ncbi:MAG: sodium:proton exchanger [Candidatus Rokuibacteriota bacterium]|nr:MAG: sodium:proton exchanger [Candidatus Rokubacteria bacterium]
MSSLGSPALVFVFVAGAVATWVAGIYLSKTTDALDDRLGLGEALGGMILLAIAGSLPELAITVSAVLAGNLGLAAGNLIGGVAMQTLVLVVLDASVPGDRPLSFLVGSLIPVLEALLVAAVLGVTLMGTQLPSSASIGGVVSPASLLIVGIWLAGIFVLNRARKSEAWQVRAPESKPGRKHVREQHPTESKPYADATTMKVALVFAIGALVTLGAGYVLAQSGNELADRLGMTGAVFGATVLAAVSALPEISTGIAAVRLGDHQLAEGDIFGGNAFQLCLFLLADLLALKPVLSSTATSDVYLGAVGALLTAIAAAAIIVRPRRRHLRLGVDSLLLVAIYALAIALLPQIS